MATFDLFRNKTLSQNKEFQRNNSDKTIHKICLITGILTALLLILGFIVLCVYTHQLEINQMSVANMLLLALGVYLAIEQYSPNGKAGSVDYFEGFVVGLYTSVIAVCIHSLFLLIFTQFDLSILAEIESGRIYGVELNPFSMAAVTLFEGLAVGLIITFCLMQYFKKNEY